jgi:hypothetical protein
MYEFAYWKWNKNQEAKAKRTRTRDLNRRFFHILFRLSPKLGILQGCALCSVHQTKSIQVLPNGSMSIEQSSVKMGLEVNKSERRLRRRLRTGPRTTTVDKIFTCA